MAGEIGEIGPVPGVDDGRAVAFATLRASHAALPAAAVPLDVTDLPIEGTLPAELVGAYVAVGPDTDDLDGWGLGPGVVHALVLEGGRAALVARAVAVVAAEPPDSFAGRVGLRSGRGNANLVVHGDRLLALHEVGLPYALDRRLDTVGLDDFGGALTTAMCAHPKLDPGTGELVFYGCGVVPPYLTVHVAAPDGRLATSVPVDVVGPTSMHDAGVSERWVVLIDQPNVVSFPKLVQGEVAYTWDPQHRPRLGLVARATPTDPPRWVDMPARDVTHVVNAFDATIGDDDEGSQDVVVVDVVARTPGPDGTSLDLFPTMRRWTLDPAAGTFDEVVLADVGVENPKVDDRFVARRHRHAYAIEMGGFPGGPGNFMSTLGWVRVDTVTGEVDRHHLGLGWQLGQAVFAPSGAAAPDDAAPDGDAPDDAAGYVLGLAYDHRTGRQELRVLDAGDLGADPVAVVVLPRPVPATLDAVWVPGRWVESPSGAQATEPA